MDVSNAAESRAELQRVLASRAFAKQERLQTFLTYIVEALLSGKAAELKERTVACEAFGRPVDYDPKTDPVVRVQARRLREKLEEYYASEAAGAAIRITLPKGGYVPEIVRVEVQASAPAAQESCMPLLPPPVDRPGGPRPVRRVRYFIIGVLSTIAVAVVYGLYDRSSIPARPAARIVPFIDANGSYNHPAFSPDGRRIAFDWNGPAYDNTDIYVQEIGSDLPVRLTSAPAPESRPTWSPDGKRIAFLRSVSADRAAIVTIATGGGGERIIGEVPTADGYPPIDWSPDGKTILTAERGLISKEVESGSTRVLTNPPAGSRNDSEGRFSPDGSMVAFLRSPATAAHDVFIIPAHGGEARQLTFDGVEISGLSWTPDSRNIVFISVRDGGAFALWSVPASGGQPLRLTATPPASAFPSISPQGNRVAFAVQMQDENIWRVDLRGELPPGAVVASTATDSTPAVSPDGTLLAFRSSRTGPSEVWVSGPGGRSPRRLTHSGGAQAGNAEWSPDGRWLAYTAALNGPPHVYLIPRDGATANRLTSDGTSETKPQWSRDGRAIFYCSNASGDDEIWRKPVNGGAAVQITHAGGVYGQESLDGRALFFTKGKSVPGLWRQPLDGGAEELVTAQLAARDWGNWRVVSNGVYFLSFVWRTPFEENFYFFDSATRQTRKVATVPGIAAPFGAGLSVSPDQRYIYFVQVDHWGVGLYLAEAVEW